MNDVKRLILGITLVAIGLGMVLSASSVMGIIGVILGLIGCYLTVKVLLTGHLH
ncbi:MAG TPA: hypothetical protein VN031_03145 [Candidatus Microsaccharimonas sp.]|nr:hypothetical protein [Candidatus Microsaccharimonas sp.]